MIKKYYSNLSKKKIFFIFFVFFYFFIFLFFLKWSIADFTQYSHDDHCYLHLAQVLSTERQAILWAKQKSEHTYSWGSRQTQELGVLNLRVCSDCSTSQSLLNEVGLLRALVGTYEARVGRLRSLRQIRNPPLQVGGCSGNP